MLTVTDKEAWDAYIADEEAEAPMATTALVNPALPDYSGVASAVCSTMRATAPVWMVSTLAR